MTMMMINLNVIWITVGRRRLLEDSCELNTLVPKKLRIKFFSVPFGKMMSEMEKKLKGYINNEFSYLIFDLTPDCFFGANVSPVELIGKRNYKKMTAEFFQRNVFFLTDSRVTDNCPRVILRGAKENCIIKYIPVKPYNIGFMIRHTVDIITAFMEFSHPIEFIEEKRILKKYRELIINAAAGDAYAAYRLGMLYDERSVQRFLWVFSALQRSGGKIASDYNMSVRPFCTPPYILHPRTVIQYLKQACKLGMTDAAHHLFIAEEEWGSVENQAAALRLCENLGGIENIYTCLEAVCSAFGSDAHVNSAWALRLFKKFFRLYRRTKNTRCYDIERMFFACGIELLQGNITAGKAARAVAAFRKSLDEGGGYEEKILSVAKRLTQIRNTRSFCPGIEILYILARHGNKAAASYLRQLSERLKEGEP